MMWSLSPPGGGRGAVRRPGPAVIKEDVCIQDALPSQWQLHVPTCTARQRPLHFGGGWRQSSGPACRLLMFSVRHSMRFINMDFWCAVFALCYMDTNNTLTDTGAHSIYLSRLRLFHDTCLYNADEQRQLLLWFIKNPNYNFWSIQMWNSSEWIMPVLSYRHDKGYKYNMIATSNNMHIISGYY